MKSPIAIGLYKPCWNAAHPIKFKNQNCLVGNGSIICSITTAISIFSSSDDVIMAIKMVLTSSKNWSLFSQTLLPVTRRLGFLVNALSCLAPSEGSSQYGRSPISCFILSDISEANAPTAVISFNKPLAVSTKRSASWQPPSFTRWWITQLKKCSWQSKRVFKVHVIYSSKTASWKNNQLCGLGLELVASIIFLSTSKYFLWFKGLIIIRIKDGYNWSCVFAYKIVTRSCKEQV